MAEASTERSWRALVRGFWSLGLGLGLSAFFWLLALLERHFVNVTHSWRDI
jgi:hypothetical protein